MPAMGMAAGSGLREHIGRRAALWSLSLIALVLVLPMFVFASADGMAILLREARDRAAAFA